MVPRRLAFFLLATAVVLAGCGAGTGTQTAEPTAATPTETAVPSSTDGQPEPTESPGADDMPSAPTDTPDGTPGTPTDQPATPTATPFQSEIPVKNGTLPFDHVRVYEQVQALVGKTAPPPSQIVLVKASDDDGGFGTVPDPFARTMLGVPEPNPAEGPRYDGTVITAHGATEAEILVGLAHEYFHNIQFEQVRDTQAFEMAFADDHQTGRVGAGIIEGTASYVSTEYMHQYTNYSAATIRNASIRYANLTGADRYEFAPYYFGERYVAGVSDATADHWAVYDEPPETTEQLIHQYRPGTEPPRPLSVSVTGDWAVDRQEPLGELFVRLVLRSQLNRSQAAAGAAGWGNDELLELSDGPTTGYAWVLRWDDAANASEFRTAFESYLDGRATPQESVWTTGGTTFDVRQPSRETVVVLVGPQSFVEGTTVSVEGSEVTVDPGPEN